MKKKKVTQKENEWKGVLQEETPIPYQESKSNVTPDSYNPTATKGSDYDIDKEGVNKDWDKELSEFIKNNPVKQKRIYFNNTLTFWQLLPSVAVDLLFKEIDISWLCFGISISYKKN